MLAAERKLLILELVNRRKFVKVVDLSRELKITEVTVRRDLEELDEQKKVRRVHGGAIAISPVSKVDDRTELLVRNMDEKRKIAQKAYEFIDDNDALLMDCSTTVLELAKLMAQGDLKHVSVITNSFDIVSILGVNPKIDVFHTGGLLVPASNSSVGTITADTLSRLRADKCFLGANGISSQYGYSCPSFDEAAVKVAMLHSSNLRFILADRTKFGETYLGKFADFTDYIDFLITDEVPEELDGEPFPEGVNVVCAT